MGMGGGRNEARATRRAEGGGMRMRTERGGRMGGWRRDDAWVSMGHMMANELSMRGQ